MNSLRKLDFQAISSRFTWRTMEGEILTLDQMSTKHIFNSMKMIFNHLAEAHGGEPVWFQQHYSDYAVRSRRKPQVQNLVRQVVLFCWEIERRGDLPEKYQSPYAQIYNQIAGVRLLSDVLLTITDQRENR